MRLDRHIGGLSSREQDMGGYSSKEGFYIYYTTGNHPNLKIWKEEKIADGINKEVSILDLKSIIISLSLYIIFTACSMVLTTVANPHFEVLLIACLINIFFLPSVVNPIAAIINIAIDLPTRQWHDCEHRSIDFIEKNLAGKINSSFKEFEDCPGLNIYCGSIQLVLFFQIIFPVYLFSFMFLAGDWNNLDLKLLTITIIAIFFIDIMTVLIFEKLSFKTVTPKTIAVFLPVLLLPLLVEKYCSLAKPSREKQLAAYEASLDILRRMRENKNQNST